ncbi:MAG: amidophosphoribosyltransferase [Gemmatimonadetes bacterium]|nr:amidophosphoribosyltransferase [Gemmatimonadota bacterium]MBA3968560.1 amidophosphoribosyltransferase [Gemmatimonadota bacterium]MDQ3308621.1 amidophosphoribosyltransferase [Gemmatimonadota bacterium]
MCGIVAVSGVPGAAQQVFLGLYSLQHRGQEAAGIVAVGVDGSARVHKAAGLVSEAFEAEDIARLPGNTAIGHIRYSTAGGAGLHNAQPILVRYAEGELALAHNGNLTNAQDLRTRLVEEGALFQSSIDSEVIVHLIARSRRAGVEAQIDDALSQLEGAYSLLITVGDTLYAARDPFGFRPLVLGRLGDATVVASEPCALDIIKASYIRDIEPGEVLRIRGGQVEKLRPLPPAGAPRPCVFELVYFARPDSHLWGQSVDRARRAFGRRLAVEQPADADLVISVPDSANSAALGYAEASGLPFELGLIRNHYIGRTFIEPSQAGRDFKVRMKYNTVREVLDGRRVVVVDDSLVRGTTSRGLVSMLRDAGAREIHFRLASPPVRFPCFYGIDLPTREELIAADMSTEEIREYLHVDSLGYLSLEGMLESVAASGTFCHACFSGEYTAPLVDIERGYPAHVGCG